MLEYAYINSTFHSLSTYQETTLLKKQKQKIISIGAIIESDDLG